MYCARGVGDGLARAPGVPNCTVETDLAGVASANVCVVGGGVSDPAFEESAPSEMLWSPARLRRSLPPP